MASTLPSLVISLLLWLLTFLGIITVGFWLLEFLFSQNTNKKREVLKKDIQIRILTINGEKVVEKTLNQLPKGFSRVTVIAEKELNLNQAEVFKVPENFECDAVRKGRAIEWARKNLECKEDYILYLDEDSRLKKFPGAPEKDIVQLRESPQPTSSGLASLADIFRIGIRAEQLAFPKLRIPLFTWGGGLLVRKEVEDQITWNRKSLVEDTLFSWKASLEKNASFTVSDIQVYNQSPPTIKSLLQQRRRWAGGNHKNSKILPQRYKVLTRLRNYSWALTPLTALIIPVFLFLTPVKLIGKPFLIPFGIFFLSIIPIWHFLGLKYYGELKSPMILTVLLSPLAAALHGIGGAWGIISPPEKFKVTPKVVKK